MIAEFDAYEMEQEIQELNKKLLVLENIATAAVAIFLQDDDNAVDTLESALKAGEYL